MSRRFPPLFGLILSAVLAAGARPALAQFDDPVGATVTPSAASPGQQIELYAQGLVVGREYQVQISNSGYTTVHSFTAARVNDRTNFTVPTFAPGNRKLRLVHDQFGLVTDYVQPFRVLPQIDVLLLGDARAGDLLDVRVDHAATGRLTLTYAGRVIFGPRSVDSDSITLKPRLPGDVPASLPASVDLIVELHGSDGAVAQRTVQPLLVQPPRSGIFALPSPFQSSQPVLRPGERTSISGQLNLDGLTSPEDLDIKPYWRGPDGALVPLSAPSISVDASGNVNAEVQAPSFGSMSARVSPGSGSIVLLTERDGPHGRPERVSIEVGGLQTTTDHDDQADLNIVVRERLPGETRPLAGALALVTAEAPLLLPQVDLGPDVIALPECDSGLCASGQGIALFHDHERSWGSLQANQVFSNLQAEPSPGYQAVIPKPECGPSFSRRVTAADGRAEFLLQSNLEDGIFAVPDLQVARLEPVCQTIIDGQGQPRQSCNYVNASKIEFTLKVYTLHTGAGYRDAEGHEIPGEWQVRYDLDTEEWNIRQRAPDLGPWQNFQTSANLVYEVPRVTGPNPVVSIGPPRMWSIHENGTTSPIPFLTEGRRSTTFGPFINYSRMTATRLFDPFEAPMRAIGFDHTPGAAGSLVSARLRMQDKDGTWFTAGAFFQQNDAGCGLEDPQVERWELTQDPLGTFGPLRVQMRTPDDLYLNAGEHKRCGLIEVENALGHTGDREVCFHWDDPPAYFSSFTDMAIADENIAAVRLRSKRIYADDATESDPIPPILGEQPEPAEPRVNAASNFRSIDDWVIGGISTAQTRAFEADVAEQFSQPADDVGTAPIDANSPTTTTIGSNSWETILDITIPLIRWYWGIPEVFSAEVYADLRIAAEYFLGGTLAVGPDGEVVNMRAAAAFALMIYVGVDIDVLFGLLFDAGAYFVGSAVSELPVEVIDNEPQNIEPCFRFKLDFGGYFDPCPFCPTPVITFEENFVDAQNPTNCSGWDGPDQHSKGSLPIFSIDDARRLVRHPFAAYDRDGNGHLLALDDTHTLQATRLFDSTPDDVSTVLSDAPAIRHPRIAYYDVNRAVAVWVESALDRATFTTTDNPRREQNQHLVWSHWDGRAWSPKAELTPALSAAGEAHPAIAPCFAGDVDCPAAGEVSLVWQRFSRDAGGLQKSVIMHAYFADGAWETPTSVAPTLARVLDLTPSVSYLGANPAVIWVRNTEPGSSTAIQANPDARQLWYRVIGAGSAASAGNVPTGVVAPSLLAKAPSSLYIAFTRADGDTGFLGTRQALHTSFATCTAGNCGFSWRRVSLPGSRSIYGEKPIIVDTGGEPSIVMRALHLGAGETNGASQPGDPLGTALISGDLVRLETSFQSTRAYMSPITNDGAMYFGHTATYNRKTGETIALGVPSVPPIPAPLRAVLKSVGYTGVAPASKQAAVTGGLQFNALEGGPDFAIEQLSSIGRPVGGESLQLFLAVANRGKGYLPASMGPARLEVRLDDPAGSGPPLLSLALPALAPAERFAEAPTITVPADISTNDAHTLYARIVTESAGTDTDGSNNEERLDFAGLAVPGPVRSELIPNVPFVQLTWPYTGDDRVVGFRIYVEDGDGTWWPLGSSLVNGFLDLTSQFGAPRRYAVASYSADGVESERSEPITAVPVLALGNRVFESGFEEVDEP